MYFLKRILQKGLLINSNFLIKVFVSATQLRRHPFFLFGEKKI